MNWCSVPPSWAMRRSAITDRNSVAGVVRAHIAAKQSGLKLLIGAESGAARLRRRSCCGPPIGRHTAG